MSLTTPTLRVEPGGTVTTDLRVRNAGSVVDQFSFQPLGDAAAWITVDPPSVRLFPDTDEIVRVTIAPPRAWNTPPGAATWAVKSIPQEDPDGAAVAEGVVEVGRFVEIAAELQPIAGRGRRAGRFELAVDNHGNEGVPVRITGSDPEQALAFECRPAQIDGRPGTATFAKVIARPATTIWRGQPKSHPFQVVVEPQAPLTTGEEAADGSGTDDAVAVPAPVAPIALNATFLQEPMIPRWLPKAILALLALLALLFVLWKTLLKPQVESAAREVAIEEIAPVSNAVEALQPAVEEASSQAAAAEEQAAAAGEQAAAAEEQAAAAAGGGGGGGGGSGLTSVFNETTTPTNFRIEVSAPAGSNGSSSGPVVAENASFALTDMIMQNPSGDFGRIRVLIDGSVVLESALENFRDLDFHFVSPYLVGPGGVVTVEVTCAAEQIVPGDGCADAISFAGFTTTLTEATAES